MGHYADKCEADLPGEKKQADGTTCVTIGEAKGGNTDDSYDDVDQFAFVNLGTKETPVQITMPEYFNRILDSYVETPIVQ